jgi:putative ABC transport system permease protein
VKADRGVKETARIFIRVGTVEGQDSFLLFGFVPGELTMRRMVVVHGVLAHGNQAMLGGFAAQHLGLGPGDTLHVGKRSFRIAGVYHSGDRFVDLGAVLPLKAVQTIAERPNEVTTVAITVKVGEQPQVVADRIERKIPGIVAVVEPGQAVRIDTSSRLIITAGWVFSLLALIIGGIGVTNTMAMSVFERIREIGIMRAVGWTSARIAMLIVSEAIGIGLLALAIGLFAGWGAAVLFVDHSSLSDLTQADFTDGVFGWGLAFALGVGLLGALYPAWRAISLTPIEALRRE